VMMGRMINEILLILHFFVFFFWLSWISKVVVEALIVK